MYGQKRRNSSTAVPTYSTRGPIAACTLEDDEDGLLPRANVLHVPADRFDSMHQKLLTNDDKILNLTKLLKLTQSLQDERDQEMRKEIEEVRHRYRKMEQMNARLSGEVGELRERVAYSQDTVQRQVTDIIRTTLGSSIQPDDFSNLIQRVSSLSRDMVDLRGTVDRRVSEVREDLLRDVHSSSSQQKVLQEMSTRSVEIQQSFDDKFRAMCEDVKVRMERVEREAKVNQEELRANLEVQSKSIRAQVETQLVTITSKFSTSEHEKFEAEMKQHMRELQDRVQSIYVSTTEYVHNYKEHVSQNTTKIDEICFAMKQLVEVHDTTRGVLSEDIETLKEWMTRTAQRLKGKLEILAETVKSTREDHIKLMTEMLKHRPSGKDALVEALASKSKEAAQVSQKLDDELRRHSTARSRTSPATSTSHGPGLSLGDLSVSKSPTKAPGSRRITASAAPALGGGPAKHTSTLDVFMERSKARRQQLDDMCADLASMDNALSKSSV